MLLKAKIVFLLCIVVMLGAGCKKQDRQPARSTDLVGTWQLRMGHDCEAYPIRSDTLALRADGTFDQRTVSRDGRSLNNLDQHWEYIEKDSISFDKRRDWDNHLDPEHPAPSASTVKAGEVQGVSEFQVLIIQPGNPPTILINPDLDCVYVKTR